MMTNLGAWEERHQGGDATPYALTPTYELAANWLAPCEWVEDWGCGMGWARTVIAPERYRGLDGSDGPFVDEVVDLANYRSHAPGILMRHVIEHCWDWGEVLGNALLSFQDRMALVLFTPMSFFDDRVTVLNNDPHLAVPSLSLPEKWLVGGFYWAGVEYIEREALTTESEYGQETIFYLSKGE